MEEERVADRSGGGCPAVAGPKPVGDDQVDEASEKGVNEVGDELSALDDGARSDVDGGDDESPLEEE